jgi:hypothetical protein
MRPLVLLLALCALLAVPACQSESGPSSALEVQPAVDAGARVYAGPEQGVGCAARVGLGEYGLRTGKASEPAPVVMPALPPRAAQDAPCAGGTCPAAPSPTSSPGAPEAPTCPTGGCP